MATCRFHGHKGAKTYCPRCQLFLCENCGKPGQDCKLCNKARLVDAAKAPAEAKQTRTCTIHPTMTQGLKTCQECGQLYCQSCIKFGGVCVTCSRQENEARAALPKLSGTEDEAPVRRRRRKSTQELSVEKKFRKGRKRAMVRGSIAGAVLAGVLGLIVFDYHNLIKLSELGAKHSKQLQDSVKAASQGGSNEDYEKLVGRLERGETTDADVAETETLMNKITSGQEIDRPEQALAARLSALKGRTDDGAQTAQQSEQSRKMWAMLSDWSNDQPKETIALSAAPGVHAAIARPRPVRTPRPRPMMVGMSGVHAGQTVRGTAVVSAQVTGAGMLDHVELLVNGQWQGLSNQPPFRFEWDTSGNANGPCTVQVVAYDATGQKHPSRAVRVTIHN